MNCREHLNPTQLPTIRQAPSKVDTHSTKDDHWHFEIATVYTKIMRCICFIVAV